MRMHRLRLGVRKFAAGLTIASVVGGASSLVWSCKADTEKTPVGDTGAPILVGVTIALTGDLAGTGLPMQNAIRVAEQQINAYGGVLGRPMNFKIVDDTTDKGTVIQGNVQELLNEGAVAILGPIGSGQVKAVAPTIAAKQIIEIAATSTSPDLSTFQPQNGDRYFFRTTPNDNLQGKALAVFAFQGPGGSSDAGAIPAGDAGDGGGGGGGSTTGCRRMAIVHNDDAYGNPFAVATTQEFVKLGGTVVADIKVPTDAKASYTAEIAQLAANNPDCMGIVVYDPTCDEFMRELVAYRKSGQTPVISPKFFAVATDGSFTSTLIVNGRTDKTNPNSPTIVEGIYGTNPDPNPQTTQYADFKHLYLSQFGLDPGQTDLAFGTAGIYDAAVLVALAIEQAGGLEDHVKIRDALYQVANPGPPDDPNNERSYGPGDLGEALTAIRKGNGVDYTGAAGADDFDKSGDVIGDYIIWTVKGGQFQTLQRIKAAQLQ